MAQRQIEPHARASVFEATALSFQAGAELLAAAIDRIAAGDIGTAQNGAGSYQSWPTAAETAALRARGGSLLRLIDFARLLRTRLPRRHRADTS